MLVSLWSDYGIVKLQHIWYVGGNFSQLRPWTKTFAREHSPSVLMAMAVCLFAEYYRCLQSTADIIPIHLSLG